jgi:ligand-binding sensor domain-containing protein
VAVLNTPPARFCSFRGAFAIAVALLAVCLCLLAAAPVLALDAKKPLSDLMHQSWSVDDGLPHSTVRAVAQTTDGYLWFATHEGAARFDGSSFTVFNSENAPALAGNGVASLLTARDGSLILGLRDTGLARFTRSNSRP